MLRSVPRTRMTDWVPTWRVIKSPGWGDFAVVTNKHPAMVENIFQLLGKDMRVGIQRPMDPFVLNKGVVPDRINGSLLHTSLPESD